MFNIFKKSALLLSATLLLISCGSKAPQPGGSALQDRLLYMPEDTTVVMQLDIKKLAATPEIANLIDQQLAGAADQVKKTVQQLQPVSLFIKQQMGRDKPAVALLGGLKLAEMMQNSAKGAAQPVQQGKYKLLQLEENFFFTAGQHYTVGGNPGPVGKVLDRIKSKPTSLTKRAASFLTALQSIKGNQLQLAVVMTDRLRDSIRKLNKSAMGMMGMGNELKDLNYIAVGASIDGDLLKPAIVINSKNNKTLKKSYTQLKSLKQLAVGMLQNKPGIKKTVEKIKMDLDGDTLTISAAIPKQVLLSLLNK